MADIGEHVKSEAPRSTFNQSVGDDLTHPIMTTSFGLMTRSRKLVDFEVIFSLL